MQASSERGRRAADASIATHEEKAAKAAKQLKEVQTLEQQAQDQIKSLKEQLTGMRSSRFKATDMLTKKATSSFNSSSCSSLLQGI